jgi:hypothetical protein
MVTQRHHYQTWESPRSRAGVMLAGMVKNKGTAIKTRSHDVTTLQDMGITKSQSARWQRVATAQRMNMLG